jgi:hypothetical protein
MKFFGKNKEASIHIIIGHFQKFLFHGQQALMAQTTGKSQGYILSFYGMQFNL